MATSLLETMFSLLSGDTPCRACLSDYSGLTGAHPDLRLDFDRWQIHNSPFCLLVKSTSYGQTRCLRCKQAATFRLAREGSFVGTCHMGLSEALVPVRMGAKLPATLHAGQVRVGPGFPEDVLRRKAVRVGVDGARLVRLWRMVPRVPPETISGLMMQRLAVAHKFIESYFRNEAVRDRLRRGGSVSAPQEVSTLRGIARRRWLSEQAMEIARREYEKPLTTRRIAERLGVSPAVFCQAFKADTRGSFKRFLLGVRLGASRGLLADTASSVTYIALETGFEDPNYFSRAFKAEYGVSPLDYRERKWRKSKRNVG